MGYNSWNVSFGEQPSAAKWNLLGANDAYFDSLIGSGTAWASWSPSYVNITVNDGTVVSVYQQIGKIVHGVWKITCGGSTSIANANTISLPITANSHFSAGGHMGNAYLKDSSTGDLYAGFCFLASTTTMAVHWPLYSGNNAQTTTNFLIAEATNDIYSVSFTYEAA